MKPAPRSIWDGRDLVVFDLDGTLYNQTRLRALMVLSLLGDVMRTRSFRTMKVIQNFRRCREGLARSSPTHFIDRQFSETAVLSRCSEEEVKQIVREWIDQRPLLHIAACRYPGVPALFDGLRQSGRLVAVLSDYPAQEKLAALGLKADIVVSATDADIQSLKPDPTGLVKILRTTGIRPDRALMVGDRFDRDWAVAECVGMEAIIRSDSVDPRCATFRSYHDPLFAPVLGPGNHY
ncbi:FMN phosphatase YigB (HAD superfamily) (plasmid) [Ensifer sp. WSM1721]|uniref:HAD family hydrolase n=1 Tax=Ensifer sp. WSM1721 TaxID=1041159 RepID=UPI00047961C6|nr:HAD family hydrolase [Ensifer sp. WSM1721]